MIDKLKAINPYDETEIDMDANSVAGLVYENTPLIQKVNELVDAVNELQKKFGEIKIKTDITEECLHPTAKVDTYEEQSEPKEKYKPWWVLAQGKLCKFWNYDNEPVFGILGKVYMGTKPFKMAGVEEPCGWYEHCEPVKPDDDIVYKGGNNE